PTGEKSRLSIIENLNSLRSSADTISTGMLTRPKDNAPFHIERGISDLRGFNQFDADAVHADNGAPQHDQITAARARRQPEFARELTVAARAFGAVAALEVDWTDRHAKQRKQRSLLSSRARTRVCRHCADGRVGATRSFPPPLGQSQPRPAYRKFVVRPTAT